MIESLFRDQTVSWVRIVNGINKYVTETSEELPTENVDLFISTGRPVAKATPRPKPVVNFSSNSVLLNQRKWIDIDAHTFDHSCFEVSKFIIRTLRHEASTPQDNDGTVKFDGLIEKLKVKFVGTLQWFQYCLNHFHPRRSCTSEQEKTSLIHHCKTIHCSRMTSPSTSTTSGTRTICTAQSGLIPGGKSNRRIHSQCSSRQ